MVQNIADLSNTATEFLDRMATTFTAAAIQNSSISEMNRTQNMPSRINFGDSGFKPQIQDGGNQVRHFVAGFIAGVKAAPFEWYARQRMNERENPNNPLDRADINLNNISTTLGGAFGGNLENARKYLARAIRASVCQ
jgi:hypothetical protein